MMIIATLKQALTITSFVFLMMLIIEYINVQTRGRWQGFLKRNPWSGYLTAGILGALPGCLGAFTVVSMFTHGSLTLGAVVTAMIATSGDEAFVMFAMIPGQAAMLTAILVGVGVVAGPLTDLIIRRNPQDHISDAHSLKVHPEYCNCFVPSQIPEQLRQLSMERGLLLVILGLLLGLILQLPPGGSVLHWKALIFLGGIFTGLFIVVTAPGHFLHAHLWTHLVKRHLPRIFLWTFGALLIMRVLDSVMDLETWVGANLHWVLLISVLVGIIPQSGPHLLFLTLFVEGVIPFGVLLASSIAQDGHGMLPLLAESRRSFLQIKLINMVVSLLVGGTWLLAAK